MVKEYTDVLKQKNVRSKVVNYEVWVICNAHCIIITSYKLPRTRNDQDIDRFIYHFSNNYSLFLHMCFFCSTFVATMATSVTRLHEFYKFWRTFGAVLKVETLKIIINKLN